MNFTRAVILKNIAVFTAVFLFALPALAAFDPNDAHYPQQWYLPQVGMPLAWEVTTGGPDVVVAVIDTGVDIYHPDLRNQIWTNPGEVPHDGKDNDGNGYVDDVNGWDFLTKSNDPRPDATPPFSKTALHHGTVVAGIIVAEGNNKEGVAGIAWRSRIMPLRVLDSHGEGDVNVVVDAVDYAVKNGADIINLSFVGPGYSNRLHASLRKAYEAGVVIVVAAGNETGGKELTNSPLYPVCFDQGSTENWIVGVSATDTLDQRYVNGNYGNCVDIMAPGTLFFSTQVWDLGKGLAEAYGGQWSGTSVAAPVVSGVAALIKAAQPKLTARQIIDVLLKSADDISASNRFIKDKIGVGRVNASRAVVGAQAPTGTPPKTSTIAGGRIVTVTGSSREPLLKIFSGAGQLVQSWSAYKDSFVAGGGIAVSENSRTVPETRGVNISAIIRGEQVLVAGEGLGGLGRLRVYDTAGTISSQWYAFDKAVRVPLSVAAGNLQGNGEGAIAIVPAAGGGPQVRIFNRTGKLLGQFFAYDKNLRGGFSVAVGDTDADGKAEIIVSSTTLNLPVRVFTAEGSLLHEWRAYPTYRGGVSVAAGDLQGNGEAAIITAPVSGGGPHVRLFDGRGKLLGQFFAFAESFRGGVSLAVGDVDSDGRDEIVAAPRSAGGPQVRIFSGQGKLLGQFFAYTQTLRTAIALAVLR